MARALALVPGHHTMQARPERSPSTDSWNLRAVEAGAARG